MKITVNKELVEEKYTGTTKRPLKLSNLPVLCDENGPFGSPTSDSDRALIKESTTSLMTVIFSFDGTEKLEEQVSQIATLLQKYANASDVNTYFVKDEVAEFTCEIEVK
ncbi:hypothetical protein CONCODRAFT_166854 [Conidiobolus coronatus NRRL 28638]|uniref:Uncharacterized protein n=1 Tax=Conidiobolus coronatus (strain ATCC 28846 / CBS 209.66 / NRRL 28638) TaxID=796925 RepID=A0A137NZ09_CONC2|nr:hypothetical protein CONCODRAFT_166854 [Conidiobolus coronatus NRRL 28638]|eukprot:KXN68036.1 hypothetical protein CONCODRAFT_166854 [Conidiobolus coronatus NRRL 28638]